ncbi:MAG: phosphatase PAP2 family protein, partial [Ginsengibacter sp.]
MRKYLFTLLIVCCCKILFGQDISLPSSAPSIPADISFEKKHLTTDLSAGHLQTSPAIEDFRKINFESASNHLLDKTIASPYTTSLLKDGLAITGAVGVTLLGYSLIENKNNLTPGELAEKTKDKVPFFDRFVAGNYSAQADKDSYILFDASYALPFIAALVDKKQRAKFGQVVVLYLETIAITGSMYTLSAGLVYRSRPFVYGEKAPYDKRLDKGAQRSFYGGHVASTAASAFFVSKVFHDFNPGSKLTPYLYVASGSLTALMAYFRMRSGYHFFSDCLLSGVIGT